MKKRRGVCPMSIRVKDLAALLNVSSATVSLVLNNKPGLSDATRNRVRNQIIALGYQDMLSNEPKSEKRDDRNLLFIVYRMRGANAAGTPYFSQLYADIIEGVESQVSKKGYNLMVSYMDQDNLQREAAQIRNRSAAGILLLATEMSGEQIELFLELGIPMVVIDNYMDSKDFDCVTINNEQGVFEAVSYFLKTGHQEIGYLHVQNNANNFTERYFGYLRAAQRFGLRVVPDNIIEVVTEQGGEAVYLELKKQFEKRKHIPEALFADNDIIAFYAIRVLRELGYRIPEDISLIGFDNMMLSEITEPPLTTVQIPKYKIGVLAVNALVDKLNEQTDGFMKTEVKTKLIVRQSVYVRGANIKN